uniref:Uncharacterized protein n=1 Tax=Schistocephalus solidus TaxID=70667 RepID=A0A0X3NMG5_SCHSO
MQMQEPQLSRDLHSGPVVALRRERDRQQSFLNKLNSQSEQFKSNRSMTPTERDKMLRETKERVESNIETLDYLRSISCLEKGFVELADNVLKTSLELTHECNKNDRDLVSEEILTSEVGHAWQHLAELGTTVQAHVTHAKRYHLFYLELERVERQLAQQKHRLHQSLTDLRTQQPGNKSTLSNLTDCIHETLAEMVQFYIEWQKVELKCQIVAPLHRRMPLSPGQHCGVLLNSISLPNGEQLKSGRHVLVSANKPSDLLHREWVVEDKESHVMSTVPAPFVWLSSADITPVQSPKNSPVNSRRSTPILLDASKPNNRMAVERLRKIIFDSWHDACAGFRNLLKKSCSSFVGSTLEHFEPVLNSEATTSRVDTMLGKLDAFVDNCKSEEPNEKLELESRLARLKDKIAQSKEENQTTSLDQSHVAALTDALDAYEEFFSCFHKYQAGFSPQTSPEMDNDFRATPSPRDSPDSRAVDVVRVHKTSFSRQDPLRQSQRLNHPKMFSESPIRATPSTSCFRSPPPVARRVSTPTATTGLPRFPLEDPAERSSKHRNRERRHRGYSQPPSAASRQDIMTQISPVSRGYWSTQDDYTFTVRSCPTDSDYSHCLTLRQTISPILFDRRYWPGGGGGDDGHELVHSGRPLTASEGSASTTPRMCCKAEQTGSVEEVKGKRKHKSHKFLNTRRHHGEPELGVGGCEGERSGETGKSLGRSIHQAQGSYQMTTEFVPRYLPVRYTAAVWPVEERSWVQTGTPVGFGPPTQVGGTGGRTYRKNQKYVPEGLTALSVNTLDSGCFTEFESSAPPTNTLEVELVSPLAVSRGQMKVTRSSSVDHLRFSASCQVGELGTDTMSRHAGKKSRSPRSLVLGQTRGRRSKTQEGRCICRQRRRAYSVACQSWVLCNSISVETEELSPVPATIQREEIGVGCMSTPLKVLKLGKKVQVGKPWTEVKEILPFSPPPTTEIAAQTLTDVADSSSSPHDYINLESLRLRPVIESFDMFTQTDTLAEPENWIAVQDVPIVASAVPTTLVASPDLEERIVPQAAPKPPSEYKTTVVQWFPDLTETAVQNSPIALFDVGTQAEAKADESRESKPCQTEEEEEKASRLASLSCELHFEPPLGTEVKQFYSSPVAVNESDDQHFRFRINFEDVQASTLSPRLVRSQPAQDSRRRTTLMDETAVEEVSSNEYL